MACNHDPGMIENDEVTADEHDRCVLADLERDLEHLPWWVS